MLKALALDNFWSPAFFKTGSRHKVVKAAKSETGTLRFYFAVGLIAVNTLLLMSYIYGVNEFASSGYQIKAGQTKLAALNDANKQINLKVSEASSMVEIQSDFLNSNFVAAGTPIFLQPNANQFTER